MKEHYLIDIIAVLKAVENCHNVRQRNKIVKLRVFDKFVYHGLIF